MPSAIEARDRIILPLDVSNVGEAAKLVELLKLHVGMFKIGLEFVWSTLADLLLSPEAEAIGLLRATRTLAKAIGGDKAFMDGKLADIPNTVRGASIAISRLGVKWFNVHASAGNKAIEAAVDNKGSSKVLGVTVLTSIDHDECVSIFGDEPGPQVLHFACMLLDAGADGIICSPKELEMLCKEGSFSDMLMVTPGVRPTWAATQDQKRVMTPAEAVKIGGDNVRLVIGRPITKPPPEIGGPVEAANLIAKEIEEALNGG